MEKSTSGKSLKQVIWTICLLTVLSYSQACPLPFGESPFSDVSETATARHASSDSALYRARINAYTLLASHVCARVEGSTSRYLEVIEDLSSVKVSDTFVGVTNFSVCEVELEDVSVKQKVRKRGSEFEAEVTLTCSRSAIERAKKKRVREDLYQEKRMKLMLDKAYERFADGDTCQAVEFAKSVLEIREDIWKDRTGKVTSQQGDAEAFLLSYLDMCEAKENTIILVTDGEGVSSEGIQILTSWLSDLCGIRVRHEHDLQEWQLHERVLRVRELECHISHPSNDLHLAEWSASISATYYSHGVTRSLGIPPVSIDSRKGAWALLATGVSRDICPDAEFWIVQRN
jgi:hypothetical protein